MNEKIIIEAANPKQLLIAHVRNDVLTELIIECEERVNAVGCVFAGKVLNVVDSLEAYFIDYGNEKSGFLPFAAYPTSLVKDDKVIVQIAKNEKGTKGARLNGFVQLTGQYTVLMPYGSRAKPASMPVSKIRSNSGNIDQELITADLDELQLAWEKILNAAAQVASGLIHGNSSTIEHLIRDSHASNATIVTNNPHYYKLLLESIEPERVVMHSSPVPIFYEYGIIDDIKNLTKDSIRLQGGGHIVVNETEAMVTIDVNSSAAGIGLNSLEESSYRVNLQAAREAARQIGLRKLSGIIAIDFIDMQTEGNIASIEREFRDAMRGVSDTARIGKINEFGVLMLSVKRARFSINEYLYEKCEHCSGLTRNPASLANEILWEIQLAIYSHPKQQITVECGTKVAHYLLNDLRDVVSELEKKENKIVIIAKHNLSDFNISPQGTYSRPIPLPKIEAVKVHICQPIFPPAYFVKMEDALVVMGPIC